MSEYLHVEKPFLDQLEALGWAVIDQGGGFVPSDPAASFRSTFREWMLPEVSSAREWSDERAGASPWIQTGNMQDIC